METRPLILIHGYSDEAGSFQHLARHLAGRLGRRAGVISLADWVSLDNEVDYDDLAAGLERAWEARGIPRSARAVDVVVHSTGALLLRFWLTRYFDPGAEPPIHHLLQLAPANFGSPLAHLGRSVMGRLKIGFQTYTGKKKNALQDAFDPGEKILRGLELAAPFTWDLADRDIFGTHASWFQAGKILSTILVGNEGTLAFLADFDGSDGVVRCATANTNAHRALVAIPTAEGSAKPGAVGLEIQGGVSSSAFRVVNGFNHGEICLDRKVLSAKLMGEGDDDTLKENHLSLLKSMAEALSVDDETFPLWCEDCADHNQRLMSHLHAKVDDDEVHAHCQWVVRVRNQYGQPVDDYILEVYDDDDFTKNGAARSKTRKKDCFITRLFRREVVDDIHVNAADPSIRAFHLDLHALKEKVIPKLKKELCVSITAMPLLKDKEGSVAGYPSFDDQEIGHITIPKADLLKVFRPYTTFLLDITVQRKQSNNLVTWVDAKQR